MRSVRVYQQKSPLTGELSFPGDKSLSHRAVIFGSLADGTSRFTNVLAGEDCVCTRKAFEAMGVKIESSANGTQLAVHGVGLHGLKAPAGELYCGNSGTSMRLLMGILSGQIFSSQLTGDPSLSARPMRRVGDHLRKMGAHIGGREDGNFAPLTIQGTKLKAIDAELKVSSAQVKSAILLAGLYADGITSVTEPEKSRDHTERFLEYFGAKISVRGNHVSIHGGQKLSARSFEIAGDISSAAFFMAAQALVRGSSMRFRSVLFNPTRNGIFDAVKSMEIALTKFSAPTGETGPEPVIHFSLSSQMLKKLEIQKSQLPTLIDEIPILCVLATQAKGESVIHDADELRVKESDRIEAIKALLNPMGASVRSEGNTIKIQGGSPLKGVTVDSKKDHRIAMSGIIAGLIADGQTVVRDIDCIDTSFPNFFELLKKSGARFEFV